MLKKFRISQKSRFEARLRSVTQDEELGHPPVWAVIAVVGSKRTGGYTNVT